MAKEKIAGVGVDSSGNRAVDPTANVLQLVEAAVKRLNDLHDQENEYNEKIRQDELKRVDEKIENGIKRVDDLRDVQIRRLEDNLQEHKRFNEIFFKEYELHSDKIFTERDLRLAQKFQSLAEAINKADQATEKRFDSVNEFRGTLTDQQRTLLPRLEYEAGHKNLSELVASSVKTLGDTILTQKERIDKLDNRKEGGMAMWILIVGVIGFLTGLISFVLNILGK